jgi:superoxide dismutase
VEDYLQKYLEKLDDSDFIILLRGENEDGSKKYAYLKIKPSKFFQFNMAVQSGVVDPEEYGEIIHEGEGKEPDEETKKKMEEEYGATEDFEEKIMKIMEYGMSEE